MSTEATKRKGGIGAAMHLIGAQVVSRIFTFVLNILIARSVSVESYGLMLQFHLITTTILFLSREGIRRGAMRAQQLLGKYSKDNRVTDFSLIVGVTWVPLVLALPVSGVVCSLAVRWSGRANLGLSDAYVRSVWVHGLAALLELLAEPPYVLTVSRLQLRARGYSEAAALAAKSLTVLAALSLPSLLPSAPAIEPATAFAAGQVAFALATVAIYTGLQWKDVRRLLTWAVRGSEGAAWRPHVDGEVLRTSGIFGLQAVQKHFLAEGEKLVLVAVESSYNQGVYGLVNNLGSLVARLVFQPIEEAAFASFTAAAVAPPPPEPASKPKSEGEDAPAPSNLRQRKPAAASTAPKKAADAEEAPQPSHNPGAEALHLVAMSRVVLVLGLLGITFGPPNARLALHLLYGARWSVGEAPALLGHYCVYLQVMALNGITEAFVHAVASGRQLARGNLFLFGSSGAHLALCYLWVRRYGARGLVWANTANMVLRSVYSLTQIQAHFKNLKGFSVTSLVPTPPTLLALLLSGALQRVTGRLLLAAWEQSIAIQAAHGGAPKGGRLSSLLLPMDAALHVSMGLFFVALCVGLSYFQEIKVVVQQRNEFRRHAPTQEELDAAADELVREAARREALGVGRQTTSKKRK